jgi:3-dehydroshikimate dehydratase
MHSVFRPGLVSISFRELAPQQIIDLVVANGLQGIEWGGDVHVPHGAIEVAETVGRLTRTAGLEVASYGSYYRFDDCDPELSDSTPDMKSVLATAVALGAPAIRVWAGRVGPEDISPELRASITGRALAFAEAAAEKGIRLDFEFHEDTLTETPKSTISLLEGVNHPNARTLWQPPLQMSPADRLEGLEAVKPWMSNLHCNYFAQEAWPNIQPLKDGTEEWRKYLDVTKALPGERWILIEHVRDHSPHQFEEDAVALRAWLEKE